jgi:hypothetical protein
MLAAIVAASAAPVAAQDISLPEPVGMDGQPAARMVLSGNTAFLHGDLADAERDYRAALVRIPDFAVAAFNLGMVQVHEGQRAAGLKNMDRGIRLAIAHGMSAPYVTRLRSLREAFADAPVQA